MGKIDPLIALAIPTWGKVSTSWAYSLRRLGGPLGSNTMELAPVVGKRIGEARNELMQAAVDGNCDFIFFLGDDVLAPPDTINRLLQRMWDNPDVQMVSGMYWTKTWPAQPYIWRGIQRGPYLDWKHGEFFQIDYSGCDCLMVRLTPEMKELGPEWFSTDWTWEGGEDAIALMATEDFYFYTKTRKAGMKLWCDSQVQCVHEDRNSGEHFGLSSEMPQYTESEHAPDPLPSAETDAAPLVKLAELGPGVDVPFFGHADEVKVVRFDGNEKIRPDYRCDLRNLPVDDESFDIVHSRHVLEHFGRAEVMKVLKEWTRILRVDGEFRISVPNIIGAMRNIILMEEGVIMPEAYPFWQLYGRQSDERDFHCNGFTPKRMELLLKRLGIFEDIEVTTGDGEDGQMNIYAKARKATHAAPNALLPDWDEIEAAEGVKLPGRTNGQHEEALEEVTT